MKICKFCGRNCEDSVPVCSSCGANEFSHICTNCGAKYDNGNFCPTCGVKAGTKAKKCPSCGTEYFSNACPSCGYIPTRTAPTPAYTPAYTASKNTKNKWVTFFLCFFFGYIGLHKFYEGKNTMGFIYLFTGGLFFIGWFIDIFIILSKPKNYIA